MRSQKGHINKEGLGFIALANITRDVVGQQKGLVALIVNSAAVALKIAAAHIGKGRKIANLSVQVAVKIFKATLVWVIAHLRMAEMPLADHCCLVASGAKRLRHKMFIGMNAVVVPGQNYTVGNTQTYRIAAGHQCCSGGRADRCGVKTIETDPLIGQFIQRGGIDITAVKTDIIPA